MKKIFSFFIMFFIVSITSAQWVVQPYDTAGNPGYFLDGFFTNGTETAYMNFSNNETDFISGGASLQLDYRIEATDGWGGYGVKVHETDSLPGGRFYYDLSAGTELKMDYKVNVPANMSADGSMKLEWKLIERDGDVGRDLWLHVTTIDLTTAGEWTTLTMPLEQTDDQTLGFGLQFGDGDGELQLDKIVGFEIAVVYLTAGGNPPPSAEGSVLLDNMVLSGNRYDPLQTFDTADADSVFTIDFMSWAGDGAGTLSLADNTTDFVEGVGSMQFDYTVNSSQGWGGFVSIDDPFDLPVENFGERTSLNLFVKNSVPHTSANTDRLSMRFFIKENNTGVNEDWVIRVPIDLSLESDWTRYVLPLEQMPTIDTGDVHFFPTDGFSQPWWSESGDGIFNPEYITGIRIELSSKGEEYGYATGEQMSGTLLFDILQQAGYKSTDVTAPEVPAGIAGIAGTYSNLITWTDVPGEEQERYNVYYSESPISDLEAPGVEVVQMGVEENVQVIEHLIIAPVTDQDVTYYYAVNAVDKVGNVGEAGMTGEITNTARGVTTIYPEAPPAFAADGDLSDWDGISAFRMFPSDGSGTIVQNTFIDGDDDLSVEAWVAMDNDNVYFAFDVNDDIVSSDTTIATYLRDAPDIHLGFYDWRSAPHTSYQGGAEPDYQFRFNSNQAIIASIGDHLMLRPSSDNYYWAEKFTGGYVVECKLAFADIAAVREGDTLFTPEIGKRIRIDFGINDADATGEREGILTFSPTNQDQSWNNPSRWTHTWIGDEWVVGVEDDELLINNYTLSQNYPNPFNPTTSIKYSIKQPGNVSLKVFNILGQQVAELVNKQQVAGAYEVNFDASLFSTGIYFYEINSGSFRDVKKMMLIK